MITNYKVISINDLKPDPNQPRKEFNEEAIKEMSVSIKNEGIINAIEVDKNFVIITGEQRWRSAKVAGLTEVPVKIIEDIGMRERFIRQVQENIHQNTMAPLDTAEALDKVRKWVIVGTNTDLSRDKFHTGERFQRGIKELSNLVGIPEPTLSRYLTLLEETGPLRKALKKKGFQISKIDEIKKAPEEYKEDLKNVVAAQPNLSRDTVRHMATAIDRAKKYEEPEKIKSLLTKNFENLSSIDALKEINKIIPDEESRLKNPTEVLKLISEKTLSFIGLLEKYPFSNFDEAYTPMVKKDIQNFISFLKNYLG